MPKNHLSDQQSTTTSSFFLPLLDAPCTRQVVNLKLSSVDLRYHLPQLHVATEK